MRTNPLMFLGACPSIERAASRRPGPVRLKPDTTSLIRLKPDTTYDLLVVHRYLELAELGHHVFG
jgi:hypothetical protein